MDEFVDGIKLDVKAKVLNSTDNSVEEVSAIALNIDNANQRVAKVSISLLQTSLKKAP